MRQQKAYPAYRPVAKTARQDRLNGTVIPAAVLLVITGLLTGQLLLLISP